VGGRIPPGPEATRTSLPAEVPTALAEETKEPSDWRFGVTGVVEVTQEDNAHIEAGWHHLLLYLSAENGGGTQTDYDDLIEVLSGAYVETAEGYRYEPVFGAEEWRVLLGVGGGSWCWPPPVPPGLRAQVLMIFPVAEQSTGRQLVIPNEPRLNVDVGLQPVNFPYDIYPPYVETIGEEIRFGTDGILVVDTIESRRWEPDPVPFMAHHWFGTVRNGGGYDLPVDLCYALVDEKGFLVIDGFQTEVGPGQSQRYWLISANPTDALAEYSPALGGESVTPLGFQARVLILYGPVLDTTAVIAVPEGTEPQFRTLGELVHVELQEPQENLEAHRLEVPFVVQNEDNHDRIVTFRIGLMTRWRSRGAGACGKWTMHQDVSVLVPAQDSISGTAHDLELTYGLSHETVEWLFERCFYEGTVDGANAAVRSIDLGEEAERP